MTAVLSVAGRESAPIERSVAAIIRMPAPNTAAMDTEHLKVISTQVRPDAHAVLICDGAGWHLCSARQAS